MSGMLFDFQDIYRVIANMKDRIDRPFDINYFLQTLYLVCAKTEPMIRENREIILKGHPFERGLRRFLYTVLQDCITLLLNSLRLLPEEQMMEILRWVLDFIISQLEVPMPPQPFRVPIVPQLGPLEPLI